MKLVFLNRVLKEKHNEDLGGVRKRKLKKESVAYPSEVRSFLFLFKKIESLIKLYCAAFRLNLTEMVICK